MIKLKLNEMIARKALREKRKITMTEIALKTGISRMTLNRMQRNPGYNTVTDHLDKLCHFFECEISDLICYVPDFPSQENAA